MIKNIVFLLTVFQFTLLFADINEEKASNEVEQSILSSGNWVRISIAQTGIHKIPYSKLIEWGFTSPEAVSIFGNGGHMLPLPLNENRYESLNEIHTWHENEMILFYALGTIQWDYNEATELFEHSTNDYTDESYYFLSDTHGDQLTIQSINSLEEYNTETNEFDSYQFHELNDHNLIKSGRDFYGEHFNKNKEKETFNFTIPNLVKSSPVILKIEVAGRSNIDSAINSDFNVTINAAQEPNLNIPFSGVKYNTQTDNYAFSQHATISFLGQNNNEITLEFTGNDTYAEGWLDYIIINAKETINLNNKSQLSIRNKTITRANSTTLFKFTPSTSLKIWDVSNHLIPISIKPLPNGFATETSSLKEFVLFDIDGEFPEPEFAEKVEPQNLKGMSVPDYLIISQPGLLTEAKRLASIHQQKSGLDVTIVTPQQIYNEFSSGQPDICAIRDFNKYLWDKNKKFKYLLFFGDGTYKNKHINGSNQLLTYQSEISLIYKDTYTSDDFFGILEPNEGSNILFETIDIGIGRLPINTLEEARNVVNKTEHYLSQSTDKQDWKTNLCFFADAGDNHKHMEDANELANKIRLKHPEFKTNKTYFDSYKLEAFPDGSHKYPGVTENMLESINKGTLIFNYTGHGNESSLGHIVVIKKNDIKKLKNIDQLPVFITASCKFSKYDDENIISGGEWTVLNPDGGGIALFTTTRVAWANKNYDLNDKFYNYIFKKNEDGNYLTFGEVMRRTKNSSGQTVNTRNFTLLGDPAISIAAPKTNTINTILNNESSHAKWDTLKAVSSHTLSGSISYIENFKKGTIYISILDKQLKHFTLGNEGQRPFDYFSQEDEVVQAKADIVDGKFELDLFIPKNIRKDYGVGIIHYYAIDENGIEAFGVDSVIIGGLFKSSIEDSKGPSITTSITSDLNNERSLLIEFQDESGINSAGCGVGKEISIVINGGPSIYIGDKYENLNNTYTEGYINYSLPELPIGNNEITITAWDNTNNETIKTHILEIEEEKEVPFKVNGYKINTSSYNSKLNIAISIDQNLRDEKISITTKLFSQDGQLIDSYNTSLPSSLLASNPFIWQPRKNINRGIYTLECHLDVENEEKASFSEKVIVRE